MAYWFQVFLTSGLILVSSLHFSGCSSTQKKCESCISQTSTGEILIEEIKPTMKTKVTKVTLLKVINEYQLAPFIYTKHVQIKEGVTPVSHPVLTLNTRYHDKPDQLLALFLHEQFHWYLSDETLKQRIEDTITVLKRKYPVPPKDSTKIAKDEYSTYLHFIVCWLELTATKKFIGEVRAIRALHESDVYEWIYEMVIRDADLIGEVLNEKSVIPASLSMSR